MRKPEETDQQNGQERPQEAVGGHQEPREVIPLLEAIEPAWDATPDLWLYNHKLAIRTSAEWANWVGGLCDWCDLPASQVIATAVQRFAETVGYNVRPPKRLNKRRTKEEISHRAAHAQFRGQKFSDHDLLSPGKDQP